MKQRHKKCAGNPRYRWTEDEITKLIDWELLQFLPHDHLPEPGLDLTEQDQVLQQMESEFTPQQLKEMEWQSKQLCALDAGWDQRDQQINAAAARVIAFKQGKSVLDRAHQYLRVSLGLKPTLTEAEEDIAKGKDLHSRRRLSLVKRNQLACLLDWTEVGIPLWICRPWRESMELRYSNGNKSPIKLLTRAARSRLDAEASRLKEQSGVDAISEHELETAAAPEGRRRKRVTALQIIREEYLRARLSGALRRDHFLYKSIAASEVFKRVARRASQQDGTDADARSLFERRFLRYVDVFEDHPDALVGKILYRLMEIEEREWEEPSSGQPAIPLFKRPPLLAPFAPVPEIVQSVCNEIAHALHLDRRMATYIWHAYVELYGNRLWEKRINQNGPVFWAAQAFQKWEPELYRLYQRLVEHFLISCVRAGKQMLSSPYEREVALLPLRNALHATPLLNCVFHAHALRGHKRPRPAGGDLRADNRLRPRLMAFVVRYLRALHPKTPAVAISKVLPNTLELPHHVQKAARPVPGARVGAYSHFAYAAPIVAAVFDDPDWLPRADTVKDNFDRYKEDEEVLRQLKRFGVHRTPRSAAKRTLSTSTAAL